MYRIILLISVASVAFAGTPASAPGNNEGPEQQGAGGGSGMLLMFLPLIAIFVFMMFSQGRAQKKEKAKREDMLNGLRVGDEIVTIGGMIGEIVRKGEADVDVKLGIGDNSIVQTFTIQAIANTRMDAEAEGAKA